MTVAGLETEEASATAAGQAIVAAVTVRPVEEVPEEEIALAIEACQVAEAHAIPAGSAEEAVVGAAPDPAVLVALPAWAAVVAGVGVAVAGVVEGEEGNRHLFPFL